MYVRKIIIIALGLFIYHVTVNVIILRILSSHSIFSSTLLFSYILIIYFKYLFLRFFLFKEISMKKKNFFLSQINSRNKPRAKTIIYIYTTVVMYIKIIEDKQNKNEIHIIICNFLEEYNNEKKNLGD